MTVSNGKKILFVDDDRDLAQGTAARCECLGFETETASNSLTAITVIGVSAPDLIVLDVEMPTGSGLQVLEFLSKDPTCANVPVIILTGRKDRGTVSRTLELGATYVHKSPNMWPQLRKAIHELLPEVELAV